VELKSLLDDKDDKDEIMLFYAIFYPYPTYWSLLMEDIALVVFGGLAVLVLSVFVTWLTVVVLFIILLSIYLLGVLQPAIRKIALRSQMNSCI
jgi:hypothetical protein